MITKLAKNLDRVIKNKGTNPTALAKLSGVPQPTIFKILKGQSKNPGVSTIESLASALDVSVPQLLYDPDLPKEAEPIAGLRRVPLISWIQAGLPTPIGSLEDLDKWYLCPVGISKNGFALRVRGESMEPMFYEGDIVFIDPDVCAEPGKIVAVVDDAAIEPEATLKKLVKEGDVFYLKTMNPDWPGPRFIRFTDTMRIAGVAVGKYVEL